MKILNDTHLKVFSQVTKGTQNGKCKAAIYVSLASVKIQRHSDLIRCSDDYWVNFQLIFAHRIRYLGLLDCDNFMP